MSSAGASWSSASAGWDYQTLWQYSDTGVFPGDQDVFNGATTQLSTFAGQAPPQAQDPIVAHYTAVGGSGSYLGNPVGGEYDVAGGRGQDYTGGSIFYSSSTGAWAVHGAILATYRNLGGPGGVLSFPTSDETGTPDGVGRFNAFAGTGGSGIYWTPNTGAHAVHGAIYAQWASLGWNAAAWATPSPMSTPFPVAGATTSSMAPSPGKPAPTPPKPPIDNDRGVCDDYRGEAREGCGRWSLTVR